MKEYDFALAQYFGAGIIACYRGDKIFDSPETKLIVKKWVKFYKVNHLIKHNDIIYAQFINLLNCVIQLQNYRSILSGDIIHIRRADMQSIDGFMHVRPFVEGIN